jgi:hypothetical protein
MSEEFMGESDLGTAVESQVTEQVSEPVIESDATIEQDSGPIVDVEGIKRELSAERDKARRLQEYNEFLRNRPDPNTINADPYADVRSLEKDSVPFVEDVEKLIELKLYERMQRESEDRLVSEVKTISEKKKAEDPSYLDKMNLAFELCGMDKNLEALVESVPTAEGKLAKLEWIAMAHPLYGNISQKTSQQELIDRVKKNASLPQTLSGMPSASTQSVKPVSQMTNDEYRVYLQKIKSQL